MGMDVSGIKPTSQEGEYIRFSMWSWPNVINFAKIVAPEEFSKIEYPYSNDGSGLNAEDSRKMGEKILNSINTEVMIQYLQYIPERPKSYKNGKITATSKFCDPDRIEEFGKFLISCGGFQIW